MLPAFDEEDGFRPRWKPVWLFSHGAEEREVEDREVGYVNMVPDLLMLMLIINGKCMTFARKDLLPCQSRSQGQSRAF